MSRSSSPEPFSRTAIGVSVGLGALLVAGAIVGATLLGSDADAPPVASTTTAPPRTGPVALVPVDAPQAGSADCTALVAALPAELPSGPATLRRRPIAEPAPPATAAWGDQPVVLRCGLPRPAELTRTADLREISGVRWLPLAGDGTTTWIVVDRGVYVALTVPGDAGTGPLQTISETVRGVLPAQEVRPADG